MTDAEPTCRPRISIGIVAWNEADAIGATLTSLFRQSLFEELSRREWSCEIFCLANGCTDRTPVIAAEIFTAQANSHSFKHTFRCQALDLQERGKLNAWNLFVHKLSAREAGVLFLMDGDILIRHPRTLWNMYTTLDSETEANVVIDQPLKDIALKPRKSLNEWISLATSKMTQTGTAQLTGQLYGIRSEVARNIYLPRDLTACEDGFIKSIVCTDFLTKSSSPRRIVQAKEASHIFEAYTSIFDIFKNQKRQMIGQTIVHLLLDDYLKCLPLTKRLRMAETLKELEASDPLWLKRLIGEHTRRTLRFWRLFPNALTFRFQRLAMLRGLEKATYLPVAGVGFFVTLIACWMAWRFLKPGYTNYWPDTRSQKLNQADVGPADRGNATLVESVVQQ